MWLRFIVNRLRKPCKWNKVGLENQWGGMSGILIGNLEEYSRGDIWEWSWRLVVSCRWRQEEGHSGFSSVEIRLWGRCSACVAWGTSVIGKMNKLYIEHGEFWASWYYLFLIIMEGGKLYIFLIWRRACTCLD